MTKYKCELCGKEFEAEEAPDCCGHTTVEMPLCTKPFNPEAQRSTDDDDACDDFRAG